MNLSGTVVPNSQAADWHQSVGWLVPGCTMPFYLSSDSERCFILKNNRSLCSHLKRQDACRGHKNKSLWKVSLRRIRRQKKSLRLRRKRKLHLTSFQESCLKYGFIATGIIRGERLFKWGNEAFRTASLLGRPSVHQKTSVMLRGHC